MDKERAHAEARSQLGRVVGKRWRLDRVLGAGSLGAVYAGTHRSGRLGALKLLPGGLRADAHFRERFLREAYLANLIEHPGVLPILDDGEDELGPFLVMELLDGWSLADKLRTTSLPIDQVLNIAAEILRALGAAHQRARRGRALHHRLGGRSDGRSPARRVPA